MSRLIKGSKVILREQRAEDAPFYARWFNEPDVMFRCGFSEPTSEEEERRRIEVDHRSEDSIWFTITDLDGNAIGETGLLRMFPAWRQTDLTIIIPDPAARRRGFGTEAISLMLDLAFGEYDMHRVSIGVVGQNAEALAFYEKIGFRREGILEDGYLYNGKFSDFIMMRILDGEWRARTAARGEVSLPKVKITVTESGCRSGFHTKGQEFIIDAGNTVCPPVCMELWHYAYPYVWALLNGADCDSPDGGRGREANIACPDGGRVKLRVEALD